MYAFHLAICGNPDHGEPPETWWSTTMYYSTIEKCQEVLRKFLDSRGLGAGNWAGGEVWRVEDFDTNNWKYVGYISYNGKFLKK